MRPERPSSDFPSTQLIFTWTQTQNADVTSHVSSVYVNTLSLLSAQILPEPGLSLFLVSTVAGNGPDSQGMLFLQVVTTPHLPQAVLSLDWQPCFPPSLAERSYPESCWILGWAKLEGEIS